MASIRTERTGTDELLRDARYHYAAVLSDPGTAALAPAVKTRADALRKAAAVTVDAEETRVEAQALRDRAEFEHDGKHRELELEVLLAVRKDRGLAAYKRVYPQGLSALIAESGEAQARATTAALKGLEADHPALHKRYAKTLTELATAAAKAEKDWLQAESDAAQAFSGEQLARIDLVRQLQKNEGALTAQFPGERGRVRSYFRNRKRGGEAQPAAPAPAPRPTPAADK